MSLARFKGGIFLLEGLNAVGTAFYFNYLFFHLKHDYGFTSRDNLLVCALNGFIFMISAYPGGKFGQKHGYMLALGLGAVVMSLCLVASLFVKSAGALVLLMVIWTIGMCFTWPVLEALVSEKESPKRLPRLLGIYNCVWAVGSASAYFSGGAIVGTPPAWDRIFWIPAIIHAVQFALTLALVPAWKQLARLPSILPGHPDHAPHPEGPKFLKMAWLANPFAYIAINAAIPLMPELATKLQLSPAQAGFCCSVWFFARFVTFILLALWPGWHYHFGLLLSSYLGVIGCFIVMLLVDNLALFVLVQLAFGWCLGIIYYSSLYYSMDLGDTKAEHGGVHESAIGAGIFAGPAIGAASVYAFPAYPQSSVWGVAFVLGIGFGALLYLRFIQARQN